VLHAINFLLKKFANEFKHELLAYRYVQVRTNDKKESRA